MFAVVAGRFTVLLAALTCCTRYTGAAAAASSSWRAVAPMAAKRNKLGTGVLNSTLYAIGGYDFDIDVGNPYFASVEAYTPATNSWASVANMSEARFDMGVGVLWGVLYAVGGSTVNPSDPDSTVCTSTVEAYHPGNNSWARVAPMSVQRDSPGVGVLGGLLYAVGGSNTETYLRTVEAYNPATNTWTVPDEIAPMSVVRFSLGVGVLGGKLYAVGGATGDGPYLASAEVYTPATNSWALVAPMSVARVELGVGVLGGMLYAMGGWDGSSESVFASVEAYNPANNSWAHVAPMPVQAEGLGVGVLEGVLYAMGGRNFGNYALANVGAYHPANGSYL